MTEWEFEIDGQNIIGYIEDNKLTIPNYYDKEPLTKCEVDKHGCVVFLQWRSTNWITTCMSRTTV